MNKQEEELFDTMFRIVESVNNGMNDYAFGIFKDAIAQAIAEHEQKQWKDAQTYLLNKLTEHWDKHGDSRHYEGIKMAKRVIMKLPKPYKPEQP